MMVNPVDKFGVQNMIAEKAQALGAGATGNAAPNEKQKAAQEFVSLLFLEVLKAMRASIPKGGLFESDSLQSDVYMTLADTEVSRAIAGREGMGLRKIIEKALDRSAGKAIESGATKALDSNAARPLHLSALKTPSAGMPEDSHNHDFDPPATGAVSSGFGFRADPFTGESKFHKGLDIAAPLGSPIKAAAAGKVVFSGWADGYGNVVTVDHGDGIMTRYAHTAANLVNSGDDVAAGQEIALVGSTGRSTAPHLHFEVHKNGQAIDPMQVVGFQQFASGVKRG
ncbi:MAG: peptidoglycan DD-metalloendopeptidase family protein [Candidatus Binatia bacterium]